MLGKHKGILNGPNGGILLGAAQLCLAVGLFASGLFLGLSLHNSEFFNRLLPAENHDHIPYILIGLLALIGGLIVGIYLFLTHRLRLKLMNAQSKASDLAFFDDLTGLINRRHFYERFEEELDRCRRYGTKIALIMIDIDHFKKVNDELGHPLGDVALSEVARLLKANIRTSDIIARYGGEEFVILIPSQGKSAGIHVAEKLRNVVEVNDLALEGPVLKVTISAGVADSDDLPERCADSTASLIRLADHAMLRAKERGRNRVEAHRHSMERQLKLI